MNSILVDEHTELKLIHLNEAEKLYSLVDSCRPHLRKWLPWVDNTKSSNDTKGFINFSMKQFEEDNGFQLGIWHRGALAGMIGLHKIDWNNKATSIGYWIGEQFEGKGLISKSCLTLIHVIFQELQLNRIEIRAATENKRSQAVPLRLGFTHEGTAREAEWLYDHYVDHNVYSILRNDYIKLSNR
ncbi:GNAT family N-acetyltransferase [Bacillus solimangrovi]|uniref:Alanine acetyltransferase n=1 Tax=Bacillus solimangrovi TaxID=1305675 RepID=A0A1E5LFW5_9BACI|nr:GNAT family protein [Bacillus solimangrovi]OEH92963.1 alanine acetyltransferase [Bacillus solimangrovi]